MRRPVAKYLGLFVRSPSLLPFPFSELFSSKLPSPNLFPFLQPLLDHHRDTTYTKPTQFVKDANDAAERAEKAAMDAEKQYNVANTAAKGKPFPSMRARNHPG